MDIQKFLDLNTGKWFAQRTHYDLNPQQSDNSKAELTVDHLSIDDQEIRQFCQQQEIQPNLTICGMKVSWDNSVDWGKTKQTGSALIIFIPDANNTQMGQLIRNNKHFQPTVMKGRYSIGKDEVLTLILEDENVYIEERQWFASENLRLRTNLVKSGNGVNQTAFYSEIRKLPPKPPEATADAVTQV
jgi:phycoerythrin-associated linker protein